MHDRGPVCMINECYKLQYACLEKEWKEKTKEDTTNEQKDIERKSALCFVM